MAEIAWVMLGGAFGAAARFALASRIQLEIGSSFPWGTLAVNVLGCFAVGLLLEYGARAGGLAPSLRAGVIVGFLGAFTTFSAFSFETVGLMESGRIAEAASYVSASLFGCVVAAWVGQRIAG